MINSRCFVWKNDSVGVINLAFFTISSCTKQVNCIQTFEGLRLKWPNSIQTINLTYFRKQIRKQIELNKQFIWQGNKQVMETNQESSLSHLFSYFVCILFRSQGCDFRYNITKNVDSSQKYFFVEKLIRIMKQYRCMIHWRETKCWDSSFPYIACICACWKYQS